MFSGIALMVGIGAGIFCFFKGLRIYRQHRVLADTPGSSILGIATGFVEVHGKAKPAEGRIVNSPVTRTPCLFYKVNIKGFVEGQGGRKWSHHWTVADVAGTHTENTDAKDEHDRNMSVKGLDVPTFLISWRSEAEIKQLLRIRAAKYVFGCRSLAFVLLGLSLSKLGWL